MNIVVRSSSGAVYCRVDTTILKQGRDFYVPEGLPGYRYAPVMFTRISRPGRYIGQKFADRYYDSVGFGMLLYAAEPNAEGVYVIASSSCADNTSILPFPLFTKFTLDPDDNKFVIKGDMKPFYEIATGERKLREEMEAALSQVSRIVSVRTGDLLVVELEGLSELPEVGGFQGCYCDNEVFNFLMVR